MTNFLYLDDDNTELEINNNVHLNIDDADMDLLENIINSNLKTSLIENIDGMKEVMDECNNHDEQLRCKFRNKSKCEVNHIAYDILGVEKEDRDISYCKIVQKMRNRCF